MKTQSLGLYQMEKSVTPQAKTLQNSHLSVKISPRSQTSDFFAANTLVTSPTNQMSTSWYRAQTDLGNGKIDFDSIYKYPLNDETRSTLYTNTNRRAGSTIKDRGSPYTFKERGSPYLHSTNTREIPTSSNVSPMALSSLDLDMNLEVQDYRAKEQQILKQELNV